MNKKSIIIIVTSFITAALLAAVIFAFSGIYPGSERILFVFDMLEQFAAFYSSLKGLFTGDVTILYTFRGSLGTPYMGTFAYYLASPFSFITCFFDTQHLPDAIWLMDIIKTGVIGASFSAFALYRGIKDPVRNIVLSMCYALSSAAVTFFILPMYLDAMYILPIICIMLERLIRAEYGRRSVRAGLAYSLMLGIGIMIHYYSMYMVCIFLVMYAVYLMTEDPSLYDPEYMNGKATGKKKRRSGNLKGNRSDKVINSRSGNGRKTGRRSKAGDFIKKYIEFVMYSVLGAVFSLPILVPVIRELFKGKLSDTGVYSHGQMIVTAPPDLAKQFICGNYGYLYSEGAPYIYCTLIAVILAVYGLLRGREDKKNRICGACILMIFICSFVFRPLYRVWHMFRDPVAYPHRFSFLFVFFIMVLAIKGMMQIEDKAYSHLSVAERKKRAGKEKDRKQGAQENADHIVINIAAGVLMIALITINGVKITNSEFETLPGTTRSLYESFLYNTVPLIEKAKEDSIARDEYGVSLCRIDKGYEFTSNDPMLLGFNGMDLFSSSYDSNMLDLYKNLGILQYHYKACDQGTTLVTDMLFGIDYQINGVAEYGYEPIPVNQGFYYLYRNPYSLGIGYLGSDDVCEFGADSLANQNMLLSSVTGYRADVFVPVEFYDRSYNGANGYQYGNTEGIDRISEPADVYMYDRRSLFFAPQNGLNLYMNYDLVRESDLDYETKSNSEMFKVLLNNRMKHTFTGYQRAYNMYLGRNFINEEYVVEIYGDTENRPLHLYVMDTEALERAYKTLEQGRFIADGISPGHVTGHITVIDQERNELIFTISYDERFRIYVDGDKADTYAYAGALLTVPDLSMGEHTVEIVYR
ncbi:MAG: YfhO family protein [Lachnospiraceae bacterium]|nr:YfhO family protein [Lachnospiraceae bacterium]